MNILKSKELINYNGGTPFARALFDIDIENGFLKGNARLEGYESIKVELSEEFPLGENDPIKAARSMKYWLEADLCNLLLEFEEGVRK